MYPAPGKQLEIRQIDGQYEVFTLVEKTVKHELAEFIKKAPNISTPSESLLAGGIAMALCYIARVSLLKHKQSHII